MPEVLKTLSNNYIEFEGKTIRAFLDEDGVFWFNLRESARAMQYKEIGVVMDRVVNRKYVKALNKIKTDMPGQPSTLYVRDSGFYELMTSSKLPSGKRFKAWLFEEVIPSLQAYGYYILNKEKRAEMAVFTKQIKRLTKEKDICRSYLVKRKLPLGGMVYAINFSDKYSEQYRIGQTTNANKRFQVYDTHGPVKVDPTLKMKTPYPEQVEACIKSHLHKFRYKDNKDMYQCSLSTLRKVFNRCIKTIHDINESQTGGADVDRMVEEIDMKIEKLRERRDKLRIRIAKLDQQIKEEMEATRQEYAQYI